MNRIIAFDYLRTVAIIGIVVCHFCFNFPETTWLGGWCGGTFNALFLMMSALLLGMAWHRKGKPKYGFDFLKHRFGKLCKTYYPFLVTMFVFCYAVGGYSIGAKDVAMHIFYLPWFDKIPSFGHLWFITMIAICYLTVCGISRLRTNWEVYKWLIYSAVVTASIMLMVLLGQKGQPGYMFLYLTMFLISFLESRTIVKVAEKKHMSVALLQLAIIAGSLFLIHSVKLSDEITKIICMIVAFSIFGLLSMGLKNAKSNCVVNFIAAISFEIYLVHHVFAFGRFSVMKIVPNWWLGFLLLVAMSISLGWCLNKIGNIRISK